MNISPVIKIERVTISADNDEAQDVIEWAKENDYQLIDYKIEKFGNHPLYPERLKWTAEKVIGKRLEKIADVLKLGNNKNRPTFLFLTNVESE